VATLQLITTGTVGQGHGGDVFACAYSADGAFVLSAGWDGHLRLWETNTGTPVTSLQAGPKPLSACAFTPQGLQWLSGSMDGLLNFWDAQTHALNLSFVAHTRPISAITFSPDGQLLATASWDRQIFLRKAGKEREGRTLSGHQDIVTGCRFMPDGRRLLSWSHDGTVRYWDTEFGSTEGVLGVHDERVTAAGVSPDGRFAASGSRDGLVKLYDMNEGTEVGSVSLPTEVRGCFFLLDGQSLVTVDAEGWITLFLAPGLEPQAELGTGVKAQSCELSPTGVQLALGAEDGYLYLVAVEGMENAPLVVTAAPHTKQKKTLFGKKVVHSFRFTCPVCRHVGEVERVPGQPIACGSCRRKLRLNAPARQLQKG
jgi:WD40 repeat protein